MRGPGGTACREPRPWRGPTPPALTVPPAAPLVLWAPFCDRAHRSRTVRGQGCRPASIQRASRASPAPWAQQGPRRKAPSEGAERLGPEVAHSRPAVARPPGQGLCVVASAHTTPPGPEAAPTQGAPGGSRASMTVTSGARSRFLSSLLRQRPSSPLRWKWCISMERAYCAPLPAASPTGVLFGGRRACLVSPPALGGC